MRAAVRRNYIPGLSIQQEAELLSIVNGQLSDVHELLPELLLELLQENPSGDMPYHGNLHTVLFVRSILLLSQDPRIELSHEELLALITAAMFHDCDYQTTSGDDFENIRAAQKAWLEKVPEWLSVDPGLVSRLIYATYLEEPLSLTHPEHKLNGLMRDADLLGWIFPEYLELLYLGLWREKGFEPYRSGFLTRFTFYNEPSRELIREAGLA